MKDQFHPHFTQISRLSFILFLQAINLCAIKPKSLGIVKGIFGFVKMVFWLGVHSRTLNSLLRHILPGSNRWFCRLPILLLMPLAVTACAPRVELNQTEAPSPRRTSQEWAFASDSFIYGRYSQESNPIATSTPSTRIKDPEDATSPSNTIPPAELAVFSSPDGWKDMPIIPVINPNVVQIYTTGISRGNDPHVFSKVGDCSASNSWFLGPFDGGENAYRLGEHTYLEPVIDHFKGSFARDNISAKNGFNAASVLSPIWADPEVCNPGETPLVCEYRITKPSVVFIMLGTNDRWHMETFEEDMREIIEFSLDQSIIPIIATKPDNFEGDESINRLMVQLAVEYQIPLWNFWAAIQPLPNAGLDEDGVHLSWGLTHFDDPDTMKLGWPVRNLTAMQTLYSVWQAVYDPSVDEIDVLR